MQRAAKQRNLQQLQESNTPASTAYSTSVCRSAHLWNSISSFDSIVGGGAVARTHSRQQSTLERSIEGLGMETKSAKQSEKAVAASRSIFLRVRSCSLQQIREYR